MDDDGALLDGGGDSGPVVRIGRTVRRRLGPWSPSVHALLRHLEAVGFDGAPRVSGVDDHGREVLAFIEGADGRASRCHDDAALVAVADLIRRFHDAVEGFVAPAGSVWRPCPSAPGGGLVCHNDLSPANTIYRDGRPVALIDWDLAVPSTAGWDLSYAVRTFVPLYAEQDCAAMGYEARGRERRLRLFCDAYGVSDRERGELLPLVLRRLASEDSPFAQRCVETLQREWLSWSRALD